jgi:hypothetical protein
MIDPALPISEVADTAAVTGHLTTITRRLQFTPVVMPYAVIGGTPRPDGYQSVDSTSYYEIFRVDGFLTAPYLDYDIQVADTWGSSTPTSIDWKIEAVFQSAVVPTLVSGSGPGGTQFAAIVNVLTLVSEVIYSEFMSLRLSVKRTGGAGEAAAVRMVKPWMVRATS